MPINALVDMIWLFWMADHLVWLHEWVNITFSAVTFIESYIPQTVAVCVGRKQPIKTLMMFTLNVEWVCTVEELNADRLFTRQRARWNRNSLPVFWAAQKILLVWSQVVKGNSERRPGIQFYGLPALQHLCAVEHHSCWGQSVPFLKSVIMWLMLLEVFFFFLSIQNQWFCLVSESVRWDRTSVHPVLAPSSSFWIWWRSLISITPELLTRHLTWDA